MPPSLPRLLEQISPDPPPLVVVLGQRKNSYYLKVAHWVLGIWICSRKLLFISILRSGVFEVILGLYVSWSNEDGDGDVLV
jgi:hypothetical protein